MVSDHGSSLVPVPWVMSACPFSLQAGVLRRARLDDAASARYGSSDSQPARFRSFHSVGPFTKPLPASVFDPYDVVSSSPLTNPISTSVASSGPPPKCQV